MYVAHEGVQLFMKSTAVFLGTGEVTADQLKPGRRLRGAMGGWLDARSLDSLEEKGRRES